MPRKLTEQHRQEAIQTLATVSAITESVTRGLPIAFDAVTREKIGWGLQIIREQEAELERLRKAAPPPAFKTRDLIGRLRANLHWLRSNSVVKEGVDPQFWAVYTQQADTIIEETDRFLAESE